MYKINKTETFKQAYRCRQVPSGALFIVCLLCSINAALTNKGLADIYYCDPAGGDTQSNNGSSANPWGTLQSVFNAGKIQRRTTPTGSITNPIAPVAPGDTIKLRTGYHGHIGRYDGWYNNEGPITIEAEVDHNPQLSGIDMRDVSNWTLRGIEVRTELDWGAHSGQATIYIIGSSSNIIIENCKIFTASDSTTNLWSASDWSTKSVAGIYIVADNSIVRNNNLRNVGQGILVGGSNGLIEHNVIDKFTMDGLRVKTSSDMTWQYNTVRNSLDVDDNHDDGMQIYVGENTVSRLVIRGNKFYCYADPSIPYSSHAQGIFAAGGDWQDWTIENNLLVVDHWHGITLDSPVNAKIINNTIVHPPNGTHGPAIRIYYPEQASNVFIRNNIVWGGITDALPANNFIVEHNLKNSSGYYDEIYSDYTNLDFTLKAGSPAIDAGSSNLAPNIDIIGTTRPQGAGYDIGAYEFVPSGSQAPIANAGPDQTITDSDNNGSEQANLDGSSSLDPDGTIDSYVWSEGGNQIATSDSPEVTLSVGVHTITLTVTDNDGLTDTDTVVITVEGPDVTAPTIISASASETSVEITFNELLDPTSAEQTNNYNINNGISIIAASLETDTVTLTTSTHEEGTYTLTVVNVQDTSGNPMIETTIDYEYDYGLVGHWKFDEGSGSSAVDSSGNNNTGSLINGPIWTNGKIDGALSFDGVDDAVQIGTSNISVSGGTIAFWAYAENFSSAHHFFFSHMTQPWSNRIQLYTDNTEGYLDLGLGDSHTRHTNIQDLNTNIWYHITLTWDGANYVVYVDGAGKASGTYTGLSILETYADIGNNGYSSDRTEAFKGIIDEVRIYNRALSATEILELYGEVPPADTNAPVISNINYSNISSSGATITWDTDENSTSQVEYGVDTTYGSATNVDTSLVTSHSVALTGLSSSTTYHFRVKSADASGNESISQDNTFTTAAVITYSITASASGSGTISPSGTTQVVEGGSQTYTITETEGHEISDVLVDGGSVGAVSSYTFTNVAANHTITTIFTYTITANAGNGGQINPSGTTQVVPGASQAYTITTNSGYHISDVLVDSISVGAVSSYTFTNVITNHTISANFAEPDVTKPIVTNLSPQADSIQAHLNTLITLDIIDSGDGVDADSVRIKVNNDTVYSGNTAKYSSAYGQCYRTGTKADYTFTYQSNERFNFDQTFTVTVNAADLAGNLMDEYSYSFQTKMRAFGKNKKVNKNNTINVESFEFASIINNNRPKTCSDSKGNIWATWHAGPTSNKDIYINKLTAGSEDFGNSIKLTDSTADQRNSTVAVGSDDKLYVAWQDSRRGNWDIYMSTSTDGVNWSAETRITDSNDHQYYPAIVVDSFNKVYVVWEDSRNGNQDIYIGSSNNGFVSKTVSQITSDLAYQGEPAIAVDSDNTVYVVWTDKRISGENDIYGAASNNGPWTNVAIVNNENNQSNPAIATESEGSILHLVWVDDTLGKDHIFYAKTSGGLPGNYLTGSSIIDDYGSSADQLEPAIAVMGSTGNNLRVYVCWQDKRWLSSSGDTDIFFDEINSGPITNVFVGDDETNSGQAEPALGIDRDGDPYIVWTDNRNMNTDIYYAGSTSIESTTLASGNISTTSTTTVETTDGVSVIVPAGAYPCEIEITISEVKNPPATSKEYLSLPYDFGPSGIVFDPPVTITIPYQSPASDYSVSVYWYNPLTASASQQGITDIETIVISSIPYLRFKTTHFTQFFVGGSFGSSNVSVSGGGGGGGCSMSANSQASALELLLPYIGLAVTMVILKLKDRRKSKIRDIT